MNAGDYLFLQAFAKPEDFVVFSPGLFADNFDYERETASRRLTKLAKHGLLEKLGEGKYTLSETGREFLEGELDASEMESDDSDT